MSGSAIQIVHAAGRATWTRHLPAVFFLQRRHRSTGRCCGVPCSARWHPPGPISAAGRLRARADAAPDEFWRRDVADGHVYLNADLLAQAADDLHGAAFIGRAPETARGGFFQRLQTQGVIRRAQAQVDAVAVDTPNQARRLAEWLLSVAGCVGIRRIPPGDGRTRTPRRRHLGRPFHPGRRAEHGADKELAGAITAAWPECLSADILALYAGIQGLPSVEAAYALSAQAFPASAAQELIAHIGHRGI